MARLLYTKGGGILRPGLMVEVLHGKGIVD